MELSHLRVGQSRPGYLFTLVDLSLAHLRGCNCDLALGCLCAMEHTLDVDTHSQENRKQIFTQRLYTESSPHHLACQKVRSPLHLVR